MKSTIIDTNTYMRSTPKKTALLMIRHYRQLIPLTFLVVMILCHGQTMAETPAVFDDIEADVGETIADFDTEPGNTETVTVNTHDHLSLFTALTPDHLSHTENYSAPVFFPDRQPIEVTGIHHAWLIPLVLILGMAFLIVTKGRQPSKKQPDTMKLNHFKTDGDSTFIQKLPLLLLVSMICGLFASPGQALVYTPVKDAVTGVLGKGQKIYQKNISITPEAQDYLKKQLNWTPDKKAYKVYYAKAADGNPQRYAFVLSDKLKICGGLHKYCVAVDADGSVYNVSILELTCDRSYCINTRSFLAQFKGFNIHNHTRKAKSYNAMSGATLSTDLTRDIVQRALALMAIMNGQING